MSLVNFAFGSSYLFRQSPGAERIYGARVKICSAKGDTAVVEILFTDYKSKELDLLEWEKQALGEELMKGVSRFAEDNDVDLTKWEIIIDRLGYHPVDTWGLATKGMENSVYNALVSAFASWKYVTAKLPDD